MRHGLYNTLLFSKGRVFTAPEQGSYGRRRTMPADVILFLLLSVTHIHTGRNTFTGIRHGGQRTVIRKRREICTEKRYSQK